MVLSVRGTLSMNDCMTDILAGEIDLATVSSASRTPRGGVARGPVSLLPPIDEKETDDEDDDKGEGGVGQARWTQAGKGEYIVPPEDGENVHFAHEGFFRAAAAIEQDISRHGLLEQLLVMGKVAQNELFEVDEDWQDCREYGLVLTGHSLGAGTATLLAMLLRPHYGERIHCWAYSPPGGLLSKETVKLTYPYVTSVVVGHDIIPRLGVRTMEQLRDHSLEMLMHSTANKSSIICGALCSCTRKNKEPSGRTQEKKLKLARSVHRAVTARTDSTGGSGRLTTGGHDDIECGDGIADFETARSAAQPPSPAAQPEPEPEPEPELSFQRLHSIHLKSTDGPEKGSNAEAWLKKRERALLKQTEAKKVVHARRMYLPGRVLHLTDNKKYGAFKSYDAHPTTGRDEPDSGHCMSGKICDGKTQGYSPWWIRDIDTFQEILISGSMFADHMPDRVMAALQSVEIDRGRKHIVPEAIEWSTADRSDCECDEHVSGNSPLQQMRQDRVAAALESVQRGNTDRASMGHQQKKIRKEGLTIELPQEDGSVPERP